MKALVTGAAGQDGFFMVKKLEELGYDVLAIDHKDENKINHFLKCDISNETEFLSILNDFKPDEIYNFGANSDNLEAFNKPLLLLETNVKPIITILSYIKQKNIKFLQASSSLIFGNCNENGIQHITTPMQPTTPYGCSKLYAYNLINTYRKHYNVFAINAILYNHDSIRRKLHFLLPKIVIGALKSKHNNEKLVIQNTESKRPWIHAKDAINACYKMMKHDIPRDWIVCADEMYSVKYVVNYVFQKLNVDLENLEVNGSNIIQENNFIGDNKETKEKLNWDISFSLTDIIDELIDFYEREHF